MAPVHPPTSARRIEIMFRRPHQHYGKSPEPVTPYQRAAQIWDDRIGSARVQAKNWRLAFFGCLALSGGLASALVWQSLRGTITPWVVEVDKLGEARAVAPADADYSPTDPQVAFHLARFIEHIRYDFTATSGAQALNDYARNNDPFAEVGKRQVAVDVSSVIRASKDSFRIAWTERRYQDGGLIETSRWSAIVTVTIQPPRTPEALRKNPLGLRVTAINLSKELNQ
jgi:type IV secretion system protein TrbF